MSEVGILPCLYDIRPLVNYGKWKQRQPAYKTHWPPQTQVFMEIKTTDFKNQTSRRARHFGEKLCCVLSFTISSAQFIFIIKGIKCMKKNATCMYSDVFSTHFHTRGWWHLVRTYRQFNLLRTLHISSVAAAVPKDTMLLFAYVNQLFDYIFSGYRPIVLV